MSSSSEATRNALALSALCATAGVMHFANPKPFDGLIPTMLPGRRRTWTHGSGVAELVVAGLLAAPATRRVGGYAAAALFVGVFPGNLWMAWRWRHRPAKWQAVSLGRLPLQGELVRRSLLVARGS